jgi:26S proteasome regulatory subunit T2
MEDEFVSNAQKLLTKEGEAEDQYLRDIDEIRGLPLTVSTLDEVINEDFAIVTTNSQRPMYVRIASFIERRLLVPGCSVYLKNNGGIHSNAIVGVLEEDPDRSVDAMKVDDQTPMESYADVGGLEDQIIELKEAVELPLTHPEIYDDIGIRPPKGVILFGPPGTGKTLLARAVANSTAARFFRMTGSELNQKYLGDGARLIRQLFKAAMDAAPSIVFIDEIDAIGTKRHSSHSEGEQEVQRTMLELLNQLDGFDDRGDVKVIMATNRIEALDPALIRPGRIDRKIELPMPDLKTKLKIFQIHSEKMQKSNDLSLMEFASVKEELTGADIKAICTEAGMLALRETRRVVTHADFVKAREKVMYQKKDNIPDGLYI